MKTLILALLFSPCLLMAQSPAQCTDHTVSATGRTLVLTNARVDLVSAQVSYYTTGSPTAVSATLEAGNKLTTVQTPFTKIGAVTNTTGADMGGAAGAYRYWWVNLGTLTGGTSPTVVFTTCFSPSPWEHFTTAGAVPVDLTFIGGTTVPATTIGTVAAAGENAAQWIKTYSAGGAVDAAAAAGSKLVPLQVVSTALPSLKADLTSVAGTATVTAGVSGLQAIGGPIADGTAVSGNPARIAGKDGAGLTQDIITDASGAISTTAAATGADAIANTGLSALVTGAGAAAGPQQNANLLFNGTTWDRLRSGGVLGAIMAAGAAADGAAVAGNPLLMAGQDGTNAQSLKTDTTGRLEIIGGAADAAAGAGNAVRIGGWDGTNIYTVKTTTGGVIASGIAATGADAIANDALGSIVNSTPAATGPQTVANYVFNGTTWDRARSGALLGSTMVAGGAADGAAVAGNPLLMAAQDGTNAQSVKSDSTGRLEVIGGAADAAAAAGNAVRIGGWDGTNIYTVKTTTGGVVATGIAATGADSVANDALSSAVSSTPAAVGPALSAAYIFNGTTWDRARSGAATGAAMVAGAAAAAAAPSGNPLLTGGSDYSGAGGPYVRTLKVDANGALTLGAVPADMTVDLNKIGGTAVPSTTIGTATGAKGEATAHWIKTLSALSALDGAAGAGSQQVPLVVVSTALPNLKTDISSIAGTASVTAGVNGLLAVGGPGASNAALSGNPVRSGISDGTNTQNILQGVATGAPALDRASNTALATIVAANCTGAAPGTAYDISKLGASMHTVTFTTGGALAACTAKLEGSIDNTNWYSLTGDVDCTAAAGAMVHVPEKAVNYVRGNCTALTAANTVTVMYLGVR